MAAVTSPKALALDCQSSPSFREGASYKSSRYKPASLLIRILGLRRYCKCYTVLRAFRSCYGRIRTQFSEGTFWTLTAGPVFERQKQGLIPCTQTHARIEGIEKARAMYPWVDDQDLRMYLMGFAAGAAWGTGTQDTSTDTPINRGHSAFNETPLAS